jgi:hypothetical protein
MKRAGFAAIVLLFGVLENGRAEPLPAWRLSVELNTSAWPAEVHAGPFPAAYFLNVPTDEPHAGPADVRLAALGMSWDGITPHEREWWEPETPQGVPYDFPDLPYSLRATLHDDASGESGSLDFTGRLSVYTTGDPYLGSSLTNEVTGPLTGELHLGGHDYRVTLTDFVAPNGVTGSQMLGWWWNWWAENGSVDARVEVDSDMSIAHAPEPSALALAGLAAPALLFVLRRRRATASA